MGRDTETGASAAVPMQLRYGDIWKAARTWDRAFETDPLLVYLRDGAKPRRSETRARLFALRQLILAMDSGNAFIMVYRTSADRPKHRVDDVIHYISDWIGMHYLGGEQKKRLAEHKEKAAVVIKETIGERASSMACVNILATAPEYQRRGYGGALLEAINGWADSSGQAVYLQSSNPRNEAFYNSHGFKTVGTYCLGDDNPKWTGDPVPVQIMVREPQTHHGFEQ